MCRACACVLRAGEEAAITYEFYDNIVDKLALTKDQLLDMVRF